MRWKVLVSLCAAMWALTACAPKQDLDGSMSSAAEPPASSDRSDTEAKHPSSTSEPPAAPDGSDGSKEEDRLSPMFDSRSIEKEPPLDERDLSIAVPSFLTEEQQDLYRRAYCLYQSMFGGETTWIENFPPYGMQVSQRELYETVELDGYDYELSQGRYRCWSDFDALVHSVFTDDFWNTRNSGFGEDGTVPIYRDINGCLGILDASRSSGYYYNDNFPDEFILESQTDTEINFTLIGHYSPIWPRDGETSADRTKRHKEGYEYTAEFPVRLVLTEQGWRFDVFHSALADEVADDSFYDELKTGESSEP